MNDREHLAQTGLSALHLLDDADHHFLAMELRVNASLRHEARFAEEIVAALSLSTRQVDAPAGLLGKIEQTISGKAKPLAPSRLRRFQLGWAIASLLAVAILGQHVAYRTANKRVVILEKELINSQERIRMINQAASTWDGPEKTDFSPGTSIPGVVIPRMIRSSNLLPGVQRAIANAASPQSSAVEPVPPGISDVRIMELHPPNSPVPHTLDRSLLPARLADAIASGLEKTSDKISPENNAMEPVKIPLSRPNPTILKGQGSLPSSDIVLESGAINIAALNLHPDAHVIHQNFPTDSELGSYGMIRLDENSVWDGNGGIWHRQPDGKTYIGQLAPKNFQPPDPDDPAAVVETSLRPAPAVVAVPSVDQIGSPTSDLASPYALPFVTKDGGVIVTQNLEPTASGSSYAIWTITAYGRKSLLGVLPPGENPNGVFTFPAPSDQPLPDGFLITNQSLQDLRSPGPNIILQGP